MILSSSSLASPVLLPSPPARPAAAPRWPGATRSFFYDPDGNLPADRRLPFATIVIQDYPGYDTASHLNRDGVFRLNIAVGREKFEELLGYPPAAHAEHHADLDYAALDRVLRTRRMRRRDGCAS